MSWFMLCDGDECSNTENEGVYHIDYATSQYLEANHTSAFKGTLFEDICDDCISYINEDYEENYPLLVVDSRSDLSINKNYKKLWE